MGRNYDTDDGPKSKDRAGSRAGKAGAEVTLPLADIHRDPTLRSRVGPTDRDHVAGIAESLREGNPPPRPVVFHVAGRGHFLVGGWQRVEAYEVAGLTEVPVLVKSGTWAEAVVAAASQNQEHDRQGLKRSNADKRHAVTMVLAACSGWSDRKIAATVGVNDGMVAARRKALAEIAPNAGFLQVPESGTCPPGFRVGRDNKMYPLPVPERSRPSSREEHREPLLPSWERNGASVLPLLKNNIPLPSVLAANQLNLKQLSAVIGRLLDLFDGPQFDPVYRRLLTDEEKASRLEWLITNLFPELYVEGAVFGEQLEVLRDTRFPAGALP